MAKTTPKKKPVEKRKAGQPTRFNAEVKGLALFLAGKGFTDVEMAEALRVTEQTLNNWKKAHPEFFESLKNEKIRADNNVEKSLYERACGYSHPDVHISNYLGDVTLTDITKHYPPDPTSMIFWLKNRRKDRWKDKQTLEHTGEDGAPIEIITMVPEPSGKNK